jgi:hypothetical protein
MRGCLSAQTGFDAMMKGEGDVVSGWKNKLQSTVATVTPSGVLARMHGSMAEPGSGEPESSEKGSGKK